ncbi:MAG: flagellar hook-basal body complex protein FliE [Dehalobacter sp.]|nr:flagellar hook-basal body complex protein FliE [Dehalobacter sp.]
MSNAIGPFTTIIPLSPLDNSGTSQTSKANNTNGSADFSSFLSDALDKLESTQSEAEQAAADLATGQVDDFHTPVIAMEKASLALGLAVTVRNKVVDAYNQIMQMQI